MILFAQKLFSFVQSVILNLSIFNDFWKLLEKVEVVMLEKVVFVTGNKEVSAFVNICLLVIEAFVATGQRNFFIVDQINEI